MFVSFEGPEGSGKSTQAVALYNHLLQQGRSAILTREPGGTPLGDQVRQLLLLDVTGLQIGARAETLLFSAARAELVADVIMPALAAGQTVICDRYADSTLAYQSYGRGLDLEAVSTVVGFSTTGLQPDLSVLLDLAPEEGFRRKGVGLRDRFEREDMEFHRRVRAGYLALAAAAPSRWLVVDGRLRSDEVAALVRERVEALFRDRDGAS